jgi:hypothetical protein
VTLVPAGPTLPELLANLDMCVGFNAQVQQPVAGLLV